MIRPEIKYCLDKFFSGNYKCGYNSIGCNCIYSDALPNLEISFNSSFSFGSFYYSSWAASIREGFDFIILNNDEQKLLIPYFKFFVLQIQNEKKQKEQKFLQKLGTL